MDKAVRYCTAKLSSYFNSFLNLVGIDDDLRLEQAALIILNLYLREKTSANRKEELQRIFTITDFRNITKISNVSHIFESIHTCSISI